MTLIYQFKKKQILTDLKYLLNILTLPLLNILINSVVIIKY
jgi:hypothetical protein